MHLQHTSLDTLFSWFATVFLISIFVCSLFEKMGKELLTACCKGGNLCVKAFVVFTVFKIYHSIEIIAYYRNAFFSPKQLKTNKSLQFLWLFFMQRLCACIPPWLELQHVVTFLYSIREAQNLVRFSFSADIKKLTEKNLLLQLLRSMQKQGMIASLLEIL